MKTEYLLNREVEMVLACLTPQNRLIARVCLHTGLRIGDVVALKKEQLGRTMWVLEHKTMKRRKTGLPDDLVAEIKAQAGDSEWAFPGRGGEGHKSRQAVWADVKRASKAFRMKQNVGPHSFRKVYAVRLLHKYGDIKRVQRALLHSNAEITEIYAMADVLLEAKRASGRLRRKVV